MTGTCVTCDLEHHPLDMCTGHRRETDEEGQAMMTCACIACGPRHHPLDTCAGYGKDVHRRAGKMRKLLVVALNQYQKDKLLRLLEAQTDPKDLLAASVLDQLYGFEVNGFGVMEHAS